MEKANPATPRKIKAAAPLQLGYLIDTLVTGGAERLVLTFAETVRHRDDVALTVFVLNDGQTPFREYIEGLGTKVVTLPGRNLVDFGRFVRLVRALKQARIEYVHGHLASSTTLGAFAAFYLRIPFVTTIHNVRPSVQRVRPIRRFLYWAALRLPGVKLIAVGKAVAEAIRTDEGLSGSTVVANAVSPNVVAPPGAREAMRRELGLQDLDVALICVGAIIGQKAHDVLIDAFALVAAQHDRAILLIVGDAREPDRMDRLAKQTMALGVDGRVRFLGMRRDIPEILAASDIFVSSSDWEGAPVSLLEAMANGLPSVVTDVGENRLVLQDTGSVLVPTRNPEALANGVVDLIRDADRCRKTSGLVRRLALGKYGADAWVDHLLDFYARTGRRSDWHHPVATQDD